MEEEPRDNSALQWDSLPLWDNYQLDYYGERYPSERINNNRDVSQEKASGDVRLTHDIDIQSDAPVVYSSEDHSGKPQEQARVTTPV